MQKMLNTLNFIKKEYKLYFFNINAKNERGNANNYAPPRFAVWLKVIWT